ncbi:MAG: hypothetical protein ACPLPR_03100 [Bacillota bacterium]
MPYLSVAEKVFLGMEPRVKVGKLAFMNWTQLLRQSQDQLGMLETELDPAGFVGTGRTEPARTLFGLGRTTGGKVGDNLLPQEAISLGIAFLPEERKVHGLVLTMSVKDNVTLASLGQLCSRGLVSLGKELEVAGSFVG